MGRRWRYILGVLAVAGIIPASVAANQGQRSRSSGVGCGATVTTSVTLTANLDCSGGGSDGIDIGANGVTINLNGHSIVGSGSTFYGILDNGFSGLVVENGRIGAFQRGISLTSANNVRVSGMRIENNSAYGLLDANGTGTVITGNYVLNNGSDGINHFGAAATVQVTNNESEGNGGIGITVANVTNATVSGNQALNNTGFGIVVTNDTTAAVSGNVANGNANGIETTSNGTGTVPGITVVHNRASFNAGYGIEADDSKDGGGNVVQQNGNAQQCLYIVCTAVSS